MCSPLNGAADLTDMQFGVKGRLAEPVTPLKRQSRNLCWLSLLPLSNISLSGNYDRTVGGNSHIDQKNMAVHFVACTMLGQD